MRRRHFLASLAAPFLTAAASKISVIAHRGSHLQHPENTLAAFQAAVDEGADYFELDVRTTRDGRLVILHDATLDRTTNGDGAVEALNFDQIRTFEPHIPTFTEALHLARGKCGVYVDIKRARPADLVREVEAAAMENDCVFYGSLEDLSALYLIRPSWKLMPEAVSVEYLERAMESLMPRVVAFDARDFTPILIARAKRSGAQVFVDRLGPYDNPAAWQDAIRRGADGIQTDHPAELVRFLRQL